MKNKEFYLQLIADTNIMDKSLYPYLELCEFKKGDCLFHQGQTLDYLYILVEGQVKTYHMTSNGVTMLTAFSQPIVVLGEIEFLNHEDINNDIYAMKKTVCLRIHIETYENLLLQDLKLMRYLAQTIACKLHNSNNNSSISMNYPVANRLASYLIACQTQMIIEQNFVQVAEMIGCSYRQLHRTLSYFCQKNYIKKLNRSQFIIIDYKNLKDLGQDLYSL